MVPLTTCMQNNSSLFFCQSQGLNPGPSMYAAQCPAELPSHGYLSWTRFYQPLSRNRALRFPHLSIPAARAPSPLHATRQRPAHPRTHAHATAHGTPPSITLALAAPGSPPPLPASAVPGLMCPIHLQHPPGVDLTIT